MLSLDSMNRPTIDQVIESKLFKDFMHDNFLESIIPLKANIKEDLPNFDLNNLQNLPLEMISPSNLISEKSSNSPPIADKMKIVLKIAENPFPRRKHLTNKNFVDNLSLKNTNTTQLKTTVSNKSFNSHSNSKSNSPEKNILLDKENPDENTINVQRLLFNFTIKSENEQENPLSNECFKFNNNTKDNQTFKKINLHEEESDLNSNNCLEPIFQLDHQIKSKVNSIFKSHSPK